VKIGGQKIGEEMLAEVLFPKATALQFPTLLARRARRTHRLRSSLEQIAFEVSGESRARILSWLGITTSKF
jgi:hypothetical protein